ncbi:MAG: OmpP1/FadL family transporter [Bacteroidetes bacterium]|nr:OmpP1/FadL family transporter [Bacteroidota bacterium]MCL6097924.1 OmpP1/FadL family transporter [Bacteroidota bacterium]
MKKLVTLFLVCAFLAGNAYGSGFQLNEHGARAMAMAGAFTGLANDPSAIYFNPAGITQLTGTNFSVGGTMILPLATYKFPKPSNSETEMIGQTFALINFYVTHQLSDRISVGLSVNNQYGLGTKWDPNWVGKYLAVETSVKTFFFTPVIAFKVSDNFSISAGPTIAMGSVKIARKVPNAVNPLAPDFMLTMDSKTATAIGFTAGILYKPSKKWQFGLSYRSQSKFNFTGTATSNPASFTFVHPILKVPITVPWPNGSISAPLTTPQNATFGIAYLPNDQWTATFDFQYVGWSSYDKLSVTFDNYNPASPTFTGSSTQSTPRNYKNTFIVRLGFEYKATDNFAVRFGALYDRNPVEDKYVEPTLPDADRLGLNIGFGGKLTEHMSLDIAYMFLSFAERTVNNSYFGFNGTYSNQAHLFALNLNYSL